MPHLSRFCEKREFRHVIIPAYGTRDSLGSHLGTHPRARSRRLRDLPRTHLDRRQKGYGRDLLYRDREHHYVFFRYWKSEEARRSAQEDPDMLRCWAKLGNEIQIVKVYETLSEIFLGKNA